MSAPSIRAATAADLPALQEIFRRASLSNDGDRDALLAHPDALVLSGAAIAEGRTSVEVGADGRVFGFITILTLDESTLEIEDLFTDPDSMRKGVASRLVAHVVQAAVESGVRRVEVTGNLHAAGFYSYAGFIHDHDTQTEFRPAPRLCLTLSGSQSSESPG